MVTERVGEAQHLWDSCQAVLRAQVTDAVWQSTFEEARPLEFHDDELLLAVPSAVVKDRLEGRYRPLVEDALSDIAGSRLGVAVEVRRDRPASTVITDPYDELYGPQEAVDLEPVALSPPRGRSSGPREFSPNLTFDAFVIGPSNRFAHAAALAVAETPGQSYNPLFIYGDAGLGKTHLLHAIGHYVQENYPDYRVAYISTETFLNEFVDSIRTRTSPDFKRRYREADVMLVDDVQFLERRKETQEEFFHTFNALHEGRRQLVLSSDRPPDAISTLENRLRSRFKMGLITDIQPPDLETRLAILHKKAEGEPRPIPDDVLEFIASNISDNIRELEGALNRVSALTHLVQEPLTLDVAQNHLRDILGERQPTLITPDVIVQATSEMFGLSEEDIRGHSRRRPLVTARQISMYVFREVTDLSYPAIAREFDGRDHTTIIHAEKKIAKLMKERQQIYNQVTDLLQRVRQGS